MNLTLRTTFAFFCFLLPAIAFGQGGAATGDLHVSVKDPHGSAVTTATVTVRDVAKGLERTATGDGQGGYSAQLLPPGTYSVTVLAAGFTAHARLRDQLRLELVLEGLFPRAAEVARLAVGEVAAGRIFPAEQALPVYLRDDVTRAPNATS